MTKGADMHSGDQVALANDSSPFANSVWVKNAIASGSIVPPHGESAAVRRTDYLVGLCVICLVACGLVGFAVAYWWRA
jgi:hypothetical protein